MNGYRETCFECMNRKLEDEEKARREEAQASAAQASAGSRPWHTKAKNLSVIGFLIALFFTFGVANGIDVWPVWPGHTSVCIVGFILGGFIALMGWIMGFANVFSEDDPWPPEKKNT